MKNPRLILKCYAEKKDGVWQAFCLDYDLAAQGNSLDEVKDKLHAQIGEYLYDALAGEDRAYAPDLLTRRAPSSLYLKWHWYSLLQHIDGAAKKFAAFCDTTTLRPEKPKFA